MAIAQEKVQISYSGVLAVDNLSGSDFDGDYFYGNGNVSFRWSTASDVKFGVDLGVETFGLLDDEFNDDYSAYYAAGVVEGRFGKISIGMPRGVIDQYFTFPALGGSELFDLDLRSGYDVFRYENFLLDNQYINLSGVRYDGSIGKIKLAASFSKFTDPSYVTSSGDISGNIEEFVAQYAAEQWSVTVGKSLLHVDGDFFNITNLEVQGRSGKLSGGIAYTNWDDFFGVSESKVFISYDVNEGIQLNTQYKHYQMTDSSDSNAYSFDVIYKHKSGAFIDAAMVKIDTWGDNVFNLSLGYKF